MTDEDNLLTILGDTEDSVTLDGDWVGDVVEGDFTIYTATHSGNEVKLEVQSTLVE